MTAILHLEHYLHAPLRGSRLLAYSAGLVAISAAYCALHEVLGAYPVRLDVSLTWAVATVLPFFWTVELAKRVEPLRRGVALVVGVLVAANIGSLLLESQLLDAAVFERWPQELFSRLPISLITALLVGCSSGRGGSFGLSSAPLTERDGDPSPRDEVGANTLPVDPQSIDVVRSAGNYVELECGGSSHLVRVTLRSIEQELSELDFVRIHRTALVARRMIAGTTAENGRLFVALVDGRRVPLSKSYRHRLKP